MLYFRKDIKHFLVLNHSFDDQIFTCLSDEWNQRTGSFKEISNENLEILITKFSENICRIWIKRLFNNLNQLHNKWRKLTCSIILWSLKTPGQNGIFHFYTDRVSHGLKLSNTEFLLFIRKCNISSFTLPSLNGITLELSKESKYLGVTLNSKLS